MTLTHRENTSSFSMCLTVKCLLYTTNDADTQRENASSISMCLTVKCLLCTTKDAVTQRKCIINFHVLNNEMYSLHY